MAFLKINEATVSHNSLTKKHFAKIAKDPSFFSATRVVEIRKVTGESADAVRASHGEFSYLEVDEGGRDGTKTVTVNASPGEVSKSISKALRDAHHGNFEPCECPLPKDPPKAETAPAA